MLGKFKEILDSRFPFLKKGKVLVACSGGVDSATLTHLLYKTGINMDLAHCNFDLRGSESQKDQEFVEKLAKQYNVMFHVKRFDTLGYKNEANRSVQMAARELRYQWFQELAEDHGYKYIVTAHHANDALETFLINLSRGTGLKGLAGIPERIGNIIRPLLQFTSEEIVAFAVKHKLRWREDSSNADIKYIRNSIRHRVVPGLKDTHPGFLENFLKSQEYLRESHTILAGYFSGLRKQLFKENADKRIKIRIDKIKRLDPLLIHLYELFKTYGFSHPGEIKTLLDAQSGKYLVSGTHRLLKDRDYLILEENRDKKGDTEFWIDHTITGMHRPFKLCFDKVSEIKEVSENIIYVDGDMLQFPLLLRKYKTGDVFHPLGMKGRKKLSKFFKDEKYSLPEKEEQWLLCSGADIVWIVGKRADDRFKITPETKEILKITMY